MVQEVSCAAASSSLRPSIRLSLLSGDRFPSADSASSILSFCLSFIAAAPSSVNRNFLTRLSSGQQTLSTIPIFSSLSAICVAALGDVFNSSAMFESDIEPFMSVRQRRSCVSGNSAVGCEVFKLKIVLIMRGSRVSNSTAWRNSSFLFIGLRFSLRHSRDLGFDIVRTTFFESIPEIVEDCINDRNDKEGQ